ncbi:MAG: superfamily protein involved in N-acetyl-glucosamine catabolism [Labilithrix sp.]|nr:superfamily protein involved in N-acetyl-glucosamine catabolism [Labilithrix sp.]
MASSLVHALPGLRAIASQYDAFLVDLWGVVHDGSRPFAGVVDALRELSSAGRRVIFLTNSSRDGARVAEMLGAMGIGGELFEAVISSGDVTRDALVSRDPALFDLLPDDPRCVHVGDPSFVPWLFELGLRFVDGLADADLVVATGTVRDDAALVSVREHLAPAAARGAPLVCTNPDRVIPTAFGVTLGPGAVAVAYAELGGRVFLYGKPHSPIYAAARRQLGASPAARVLAVGDLLDTDIRGARDAGIASVLVTGTGGHAHALGPSPSAAALEPLFAAAGVAPDMVLERFAW